MQYKIWGASHVWLRTNTVACRSSLCKEEEWRTGAGIWIVKEERLDAVSMQEHVTAYLQLQQQRQRDELRDWTNDQWHWWALHLGWYVSTNRYIVDLHLSTSVKLAQFVDLACWSFTLKLARLCSCIWRSGCCHSHFEWNSQVSCSLKEEVSSMHKQFKQSLLT
jgi:hypothetical protein